MLRTLPGQQAHAIAANFCGSLPALRGIRRGALRSPLLVPIGPWGLLLGKVAGGNRMLLPLDDTDSAVARRRGGRISPSISSSAWPGAGERSRSAPQTCGIGPLFVCRKVAVEPISQKPFFRHDGRSVIDGTLTPRPRPSTLILPSRSRAEPVAAGTTRSYLITQIGPATSGSFRLTDSCTRWK